MKNKKVVAVLLLVALVATSVFAIDLSAGGSLNLDFVNNSVKKDENKASVSFTTIGVNGFFDAQYVQASLGMRFLVGSLKEKSTEGWNSHTYKTDNFHATLFNLGILGKYPIKIGSIASIYPMLGFDFNFCVDAKDGNRKFEYEFNAHYFDLGLGSDIYVTSNLFIRPTFLFGIQLNQTKRTKVAKEAGCSVFMYKVDLGLGVGYKF